MKNLDLVTVRASKQMERSDKIYAKMQYLIIASM